MMQLKIKNCNNIENGEFDITEGRLNIKYAINGTGKSTISKAIEAFVTNDQEKKNLLLPFKYYGVEEENSPELIGYDQFKKVSVFNEKYIEDYVYQQNELIKNSFEIFVKSPDYDTHIKEIENMKLQDMADACYVSTYTLMQFFKKFGFNKLSIAKKILSKHYDVRFYQFKERYKNNKIDQIKQCLKPVLTAEDYEEIFNQDQMDQLCQKIHQANRIIIQGSDESMSCLLRFQGDMITMDKLVVQNSMYENHFNSLDNQNLNILFSLSGNITKLMSHSIQDNLKQHDLVMVGYQKFYDTNLLLKIPDYVDDALQNLIVNYYFENISYCYYCKYYVDK